VQPDPTYLAKGSGVTPFWVLVKLREVEKAMDLGLILRLEVLPREMTAERLQRTSRQKHVSDE